MACRSCCRPAAELEKLIGELGIDEDDHVVMVPAGVSFTDFGAAARVYWTLKVAGLTNASVLDGGYEAWSADKLMRSRPATASAEPENLHRDDQRTVAARRSRRGAEGSRNRAARR